MHVKKKLISLVLALGMLGGTQTALAAEPAAQEAAPLPAWSYGMLADGYSLGLFGDEIYTQHSQTVTAEQLDTMTKLPSQKSFLRQFHQIRQLHNSPKLDQPVSQYYSMNDL